MRLERTLSTTFVILLFAVGLHAAPPAIRVTLLGTGTPIPRAERFGPGTLVEAGGERILIDCGRGITIRLWQLGLPLSSPTAVLLTHLHSDHTIGIPDLWLTGWLSGPFGHRTKPFSIRGPAGTAKMMQAMRTAFAWDIRTRIKDEKLPPDGAAIDAHDIGEGVVFTRNGVTVSAFTVDHGPLIKPALGYRIDYDGHSVVISGDTRPNENLVRHAEGTDLLIHEVALATAEVLKQLPAARRVIAHHTTPADAGRIFARVRPKLAVYSHIALLPVDAPAEKALERVVAETRTTYSGPLEVGSDLMKIEIGETVRVTNDHSSH